MAEASPAACRYPDFPVGALNRVVQRCCLPNDPLPCVQERPSGTAIAPSRQPYNQGRAGAPRPLLQIGNTTKILDLRGISVVDGCTHFRQGARAYSLLDCGGLSK